MKVHVDQQSQWEYIEQPPLNTKILMLTKDNICVTGSWKGAPLGDNRTYKAWKGLPRRNDALEKQLGYV